MKYVGASLLLAVSIVLFVYAIHLYDRHPSTAANPNSSGLQRCVDSKPCYGFLAFLPPVVVAFFAIVFFIGEHAYRTG